MGIIRRLGQWLPTPRPGQKLRPRSSESILGPEVLLTVHEFKALFLCLMVLLSVVAVMAPVGAETLFFDSFVLEVQANPPIVLSRQYWGTFYYQWFGGPSEGWRQWDARGHNPPSTWSSHYLPDDGSGAFGPATQLYSSKSVVTLNRHLTSMDRAKFDFALLSWDRPYSYKDTALSMMLAQASLNVSLNVKLAVYYGDQERFDPPVSDIIANLTYIYDVHAKSKAYFKVSDGKRDYPVVFVFGKNETTDYVERWSQARDYMYSIGKPMFVSLKVWCRSSTDCYKNHLTKVDSWHQYQISQYSGIIHGYTAWAVPGTWLYPELAIARNKTSLDPSLRRDPVAFKSAVQMMASLSLSEAQFLLVLTFNEWHEGTQIEPGIPINHIETGFTQNSTSYGFTFIDIVRNRGNVQGEPPRDPRPPTDTKPPPADPKPLPEQYSDPTFLIPMLGDFEVIVTVLASFSSGISLGAILAKLSTRDVAIRQRKVRTRLQEPSE